MRAVAPTVRQNTLDEIITEALKDKNLMDAIQSYQMGQEEYVRALSSSVSIQISSGNTSNPIKKEMEVYADLD